MRVLLIATNRHDRLMSRMVARPLPIGLAYVAGGLSDSNHQVEILDLMFLDDYLGNIEQVVSTFQPELVGISIRNLSNHSYIDPQWALPISKEVIDKVRSISDATIVCGGPAFSILPEAIFEYVEPDLGLAGDAAEAFAQLADDLESGSFHHDIPGLVYRQNEQVVLNTGRCASAFATPPRLDDLDMQKYDQAGFGIGILTKLGSFYYPRSAADIQADKEAWRVIRPIDEVVQEVRNMEQRYGLRKVFFIDNAFNTPIDHAKALCHALIAADIKTNWNTCLAPFGCDPELISLMKEAGCSLVIMGGLRGEPHDITSISDQVQPIIETCALCEIHGLHYTISVTFGEPGENRGTVDEKLDFLRSIKPAMANLRIGVTILPNTDISQRALAEKLIDDESDLVKPTFYLAEGVRDWIVEYLMTEKAMHPRWNVI